MTLTMNEERSHRETARWCPPVIQPGPHDVPSEASRLARRFATLDRPRRRISSGVCGEADPVASQERMADHENGGSDEGTVTWGIGRFSAARITDPSHSEMSVKYLWLM